MEMVKFSQTEEIISILFLRYTETLAAPQKCLSKYLPYIILFIFMQTADIRKEGNYTVLRKYFVFAGSV